MQSPVSAWEQARCLRAKYRLIIFLDLYAYIYVLAWVEFFFCENDVLAERGAERLVQTLRHPEVSLASGLSSGLVGHGSRHVTTVGLR